MQNLREMAVIADAEKLGEYATNELQASRFFKALRAGQLPLEIARQVFGQYYLWRNEFHRWFGVGIARSKPFSTDSTTGDVLRILVHHILEEIDGDHHGLCVRFLNAVGIEDPRRIALLSSTDRYIESFVRKFSDASTSSVEEVLAALAGREMITPRRNQIMLDALRSHYGVANGLEFLVLHVDLELEHFKVLWDPTAQFCLETKSRCLVRACQEIRSHRDFWDETFDLVTSNADSHRDRPQASV